MKELLASCGRWVFVSGMCLGIALTGCSREAAVEVSGADGGTARQTTAERGAAGSSDLDVLAAKLERYVTCYNKMDGGIHRSMDRYASWVKDMDVGPTGRESVVYGLYAVRADDVARCRTDLAEAAASAPKLAELDAAGSRYIEALDAVVPLITEAHAYYDRQDYKDDGFAKARSLHGPLAAGFSEFLQASMRFSDALETENGAMLDARLVELEKSEGRHAGYYQLAVMNRAKALVNALEGDDFDVARAAELLSMYEGIADEAVAYVSDGGQVPLKWSAFASETEDFRKAAKNRLRRVRDKTPYDQGQRMLMGSASGAWMVDGSPDQLIRGYNELVEANNRL